MKRKQIVYTQAEQISMLASFGLTNKEIALVIGLDENTLKRNFDAMLQQGRAMLRERLKRKQIEVALHGSVPMLIWLGKQYLDQSENPSDMHDYKITIEKVVL